MHSAHYSRGRIIFEVFCALALAGSLAGAWAQTDASALLSAAAVAALYGIWRLTDLRRPVPALATVPAIPAGEDQGDLLAFEPSLSPPVAEAPVVAAPVEAVAEETAKPSRKSPKPRTGRGRKEAQPTIGEIADKLEREFAKVAAEPEVPAQEVEPEPEPEPEPEVHVADSPGDAPEYVPATPLFETEPFVRQQRAAFGRKSRP